MVKKTDLAEYIDKARSYDQDRMIAAERSRKIAWVIAGAAVVMALTSTFAVISLAPLKTVEPYVIRVDNSTGIVEVQSALGAAPNTYDEAITRYFAAKYVRAAEGYQAAEAKNNFRTVSLLSTPEEQLRFARYYAGSNPKSPQILFREKVATITIKSISFLSKNVVQVRYYRTIREPRTDAETITHWVATMTFSYINAQISTQDRLVNPLGFAVSEYRSDPEVIQ